MTSNEGNVVKVNSYLKLVTHCYFKLVTWELTIISSNFNVRSDANNSYAPACLVPCTCWQRNG